MVREEDIRASTSKISDWPIQTPDTMFRKDVSIYLDVSYHDIAGLVQVGLLKASIEHGGKLLGQSIDNFAEEYISTQYVSRRFKFDSRTVRRRVAQMGIKPAAVFRSANQTEGYAWRRKDFAGYLV